MAIIKGYNATTLLKDALVLDLGDVSRQAQRLRESANTEARRILEDAQNRAEKISSQLHDDSEKMGYQEGLEKGLVQGREKGIQEGRAESLEHASGEFEKIQQAWMAAVEFLENHREELDQEIHRSVLDFAVLFSEKVVHQVIRVDEKVIEDQLAAALSYVLRPVDLSVRVCPEDLIALEEVMPDLMRKFPQAKHIDLVEDPSVSRGGCVLSYGQGRIDATVETQMQRLIDLIRPNRLIPVDPQQEGLDPEAGADDPPPPSVEGSDGPVGEA